MREAKSTIEGETKLQVYFLALDDIEITPKGIEYLQENSMMKKVVRTLMAVKEVVPGI